MKVLVIGSAGFIGSNICRLFSKDGIDVVGADIVSGDNNIPFVSLDKMNTQFDSLFKNSNYTLCINASGSGNVGESFVEPSHDYALNVYNNFKILNAIRSFNPQCCYINISSAAVYGNPKKVPVSETDPIDPISPYGFHKYQSEIQCKEFSDIFQLKTCSIRIFSAYGPHLKKQLFWDIFNKGLKSSVVELQGTGAETRDFIFIDDVFKAIKCIVSKAPFRGEAINVASGIETSINMAAVAFLNKLFPNKRINFSQLSRQGDPLKWMADISLLKSMGFEASYSLDHGLEEHVKWIKTLVPANV